MGISNYERAYTYPPLPCKAIYFSIKFSLIWYAIDYSVYIRSKFHIQEILKYGITDNFFLYNNECLYTNVLNLNYIY